MLSYLIEVAFVHLILFGIYWMILKKENQYHLLRFYLLGSVVLALLTPFVNIPIPVLNENWVATTSSEGPLFLDPVLITATTLEEGTSQLGITTTLITIYLFVSSILLLAFLMSFGKIISALLLSSRGVQNKVPVRVIPETESFSFFKWIFVPRNAPDEIINHEKAHADQFHSMDIVLLSLFRIFFWWIPSAWYSLQELSIIHEYLADEKALEEGDHQQYKKLLISNTLKSLGLDLASSFHNGTLTKRLKAMQAKKQSINKWKTGVLGTFVAITVIVFSCSEELYQDVQKDDQLSEFPDLIQQGIKMMEKGKTLEYTAMIIPASFEMEATEISPEAIMTVKYGEDEMYAILPKDGELFNYLLSSELPPKAGYSEDRVYENVDVTPEYPGGYDKFYRSIAQNIRYPLQARKEGVEGKVYVQFIVNQDGSVSDARAVLGIGAGCNAEAIRAVTSVGKFIPGQVNGKNVKTRMVVPIIFSLGTNSKKDNPDLPEGKSSLEEIVVSGKKDS